MTTEDILVNIFKNYESKLSLLKSHIDKLSFFEEIEGSGIWYIKSHDSQEKNKQVLNLNNKKSQPEEIVRQLYLFELTDKYGYPKENIATEMNVQDGHTPSRADIVVYQDDKETPIIIVETKKPNEKNNIEQLKSYINQGGAPLGVGVNGVAIVIFCRPYPKEYETVSDILTYSEYQQIKEDKNFGGLIKETIKGRRWTLDELNKYNNEHIVNLRSIIENLEELVLATSGEDVFDEIFKLIYAKLYDEFEAEARTGKELKFRSYPNVNTTYKEIASLFNHGKKKWPNVFFDEEKIELTPEPLNTCITGLEKLKLYGSDLRIIDDAFEFLMPKVAKGEKGQYFTPRVIIDMCVKMLNPKKDEYILDPACGSAGFLLHAMQYVWEGELAGVSQKYKEEYASEYLWGIDFGKDASKISRALMLIAGDGKTHVFQQDSLDFDQWVNNKSLISEFEKSNFGKESYQKMNFDIILSNPPFAGTIKSSIKNSYKDILQTERYIVDFKKTSYQQISNFFREKDIAILSGSEFDVFKEKIKEIEKNETYENEDEYKEVIYEVLSEYVQDLKLEHLDNCVVLTKKTKEPKNYNSIDRHILFIQRIIDLLKDGGRCCIVLPQGIFNNSSQKYIRNYISRSARILGVVGVDGYSFKPHTGTKTSVLFLQKWDEKLCPKQDDYSIFFAVSDVPFKDKSGNYRINENNEVIHDLDKIADAFIKWAKDTKLSFWKQ